MGQWEQAREVLLSASQERGGSRGGNIEVALESVLVSVTTFTIDWKRQETDFVDKFPQSIALAMFMYMFVVCMSVIVTSLMSQQI